MVLYSYRLPTIVSVLAFNFIKEFQQTYAISYCLKGYFSKTDSVIYSHLFTHINLYGLHLSIYIFIRKNMLLCFVHTVVSLCEQKQLKQSLKYNLLYPLEKSNIHCKYEYENVSMVINHYFVGY